MHIQYVHNGLVPKRLVSRSPVHSRVVLFLVMNSPDFTFSSIGLDMMFRFNDRVINRGM